MMSISWIGCISFRIDEQKPEAGYGFHDSLRRKACPPLMMTVYGSVNGRTNICWRSMIALLVCWRRFCRQAIWETISSAASIFSLQPEHCFTGRLARAFLGQTGCFRRTRAAQRSIPRSNSCSEESRAATEFTERSTSTSVRRLGAGLIGKPGGRAGTEHRKRR